MWITKIYVIEHIEELKNFFFFWNYFTIIRFLVVRIEWKYILGLKYKTLL